MTVVINVHKTYDYKDYEGVMSVLCTPLQVKCYHEFIFISFWLELEVD